MDDQAAGAGFLIVHGSKGRDALRIIAPGRVMACTGVGVAGNLTAESVTARVGFSCWPIRIFGDAL